MYRVEVNVVLGGDWEFFFTRGEALQFALSKGKIFLAMPKDAVNPSNNCALTIMGSTGTEWWSFRDLERHALTEEERELSYKYLFDEEE
jgi:hypothetical protein